MKRRNADCGKIRRPIKRNKIAEGMYESNTVLYMKFLILWAVVITADFTFMFRFEFLWPFWLLLRSVHDSYKYKGLAFSVLFVCIAITSDLVCLFFIPVHWLLFAASTYVWVHYVWLTDKGICLPTIILWMLFVYLEAAIRWKDSRHMPHLDLCRPFAAHCIGYTVVTLGFGFKSYVGYRMRQRKQREVAKENEFYMQLLQQALPQDETLDDQQQSNILNGNAISPVTISVAQTLQTNSIAFEHHHHHHHNSSHHNDDKSHTTSSLGQVTTSQTTQTAIQQQQMSNNHQSILNSSNSTSFSRNAQASSKLNISNSTATVLTTSTTSPIASVSTTAAVTTANGHVANNVNGLTSHKSHRRSMDKEKNDVSQVNNPSSLNNNNQKTNVNGSSASFDAYTSSNNNNNNTSKVSNSYLNQLNQLSNHVQKDSKDRENSGNWDSGVSSSSFSSSSSNNSTSSIKDSKTYNGGNNFDSQQSNGHHNTNFCDKKSQPNGNVVQYEVEEIVEPSEKVKGRRNRSKKDTSTASKDNHHNHSGSNSSHNQQQSQSNNNTNHNSNSQQNQQKDSNCSDTSNSCSTTSGTISNVASQIVNKICETCLRLEAEVKKYRNEVNHMKHIENELRQKIDSNNAVKSCLQAKQRENEDLEKRLQDLSNLRQMDLINLQTAERRLNDERRQRQSLESQLNNEKKARKQAEEKATRPECSELCKQRKQQMDAETKQLRRELKAAEEAKQVAEQQGRKYEKDLRMFEAEIRNREAQQGTEVLMSALAAMQDKNSTLEKNLSAETRVKLDLFSALGEAKRQLEIKDSMIRNKDEEVSDLKAKIAQFFAVMPTDSLCLPPCSTTGSSMLRMNDTPPLQGPSSPIMNLGTAHQQIMAAHQISARTGHSVGVSTSNSVNNVQTSGANGQNVSNVVVTQTSSNLDPNATAYTPKNSSLVNGGDA